MCRVYRHFSRGFVHKNNIAELTTNFNRKSERKSHDLSRNCRQMICCHPFSHFYDLNTLLFLSFLNVAKSRTPDRVTYECASARK